MANPMFSENKPTPARAKMPDKPGTASSPGFPEKPAFPKAKLPGKTQPRNRSTGIRKGKVRPKGIGL